MFVKQFVYPVDAAILIGDDNSVDIVFGYRIQIPSPVLILFLLP